MTNYLKDPNFDQNKFYQLRETMFMDDRIMEDSRGKHNAVILYTAIETKIGLSKSTHIKKGDASFINPDGQYYCVFPVGTAKKELRIKPGKYGQHKELLKEAGLIHYEPQEKEESGYASQITYTPWHIWVEQNGLYSDGEWIIEPTSADFYNPSDIVTIQPSIQPKKAKIDPEPEELPSHEEIMEEYADLKKQGNTLAFKLHQAGHMDLVRSIAEKHLGEDTKFVQATVEQIDLMRMICTEMQLALNDCGIVHAS